MKSWISFLLPNDEYKKKRMLYFFSEGSIILLLTLVGMSILNNYIDIKTEVSLLLAIAIFLSYISGRYIISGMEYTDVVTEGAYRKELKHIFVRTGGFASIFMLLYLVVTGIPNSQSEWIEIIALLLSVSLLWFITSYISLKRSYKKNKELL
ncbi:hypothetical protein [Ornithinibacillus halophilus]|uniref:DUF3278 domain-containing protein n=1 Tax=Ornithinibacillus halophilus TaxID=930117 RepID=A0A1M5MKM0_9BACI|nr:hypothetical protein [Ornithinibacillus halophilus]SHG77582.1 hypothetical protein SAMN05216225_106011 [Ornithinibacillus halophilus]